MARICSTCKADEVRGERYRNCASCHAAAQRAYRRRLKDALAVGRQVIAERAAADAEVARA